MQRASALRAASAALAFSLAQLAPSSASATGHAGSMMAKPMKSQGMKPRVMKAKAPMMKAKGKSLYTRLGGKPAIRAVVEDFVNNVAADDRINRFFAKTNLPRLRRLLVEQICAGSGGPCKYTGRSMKASHRGLGISNAHFGALVEDLQKSLRKFGVPAREQGELLAILGPMQKDIVERR